MMRARKKRRSEGATTPCDGQACVVSPLRPNGEAFSLGGAAWKANRRLAIARLQRVRDGNPRSKVRPLTDTTLCVWCAGVFGGQGSKDGGRATVAITGRAAQSRC